MLISVVRSFALRSMTMSSSNSHWLRRACNLVFKAIWVQSSLDPSRYWTKLDRLHTGWHYYQTCQQFNLSSMSWYRGDMSMIMHTSSDSRRSSFNKIYHMRRLSCTSLMDMTTPCKTRWCCLFGFSGLNVVLRSQHGSSRMRWGKNTCTYLSHRQLGALVHSCTFVIFGVAFFIQISIEVLGHFRLGWLVAHCHGIFLS